LVGIDGSGCGGKTTLGDELSQFLKPPAYVLGLDGFMKPLIEQNLHRLEGEDLSMGIPHLRWNEIANLVLDALPKAQPASYRPYLWDVDVLGTVEHISPAATIVIEGLYAFHPHLRHAYDFRIWVDGNFDDRMTHAEQRMHNLAQPVRERWLQLWHDLYVPREAAYIATWRPYHASDLFVLGRGLSNTRDSFAMRVGED
jgi:uridine kinase